jgi:hypothetical protein
VAEADPSPITFQQAFADAARSHQGEVERCFDQHVSGDERYERTIHLAVNVQASGRVTPPLGAEEPGLDRGFLDCVTSAAREWTFPAAGRTYEIGIPYQVGRR